MKRLLRRINCHSVLFRLALLFAATALPLYTCGFFTIRYVSRGIVAEIQRTVDDNMAFCLSSMEREISYVKQLMVTLSVDNEISLYILPGEDFNPVDYDSYNNIKKRLQSIYLSSRYLSNVFVVFPGAGETGYEIAASYTEDHLDAVASVMDSHNQFPRLYTYLDEEYIVYMTGSMDNSFVLGVELYQDRILKSLKEIESSYPFGVFLLDAGTGSMLGQGICTPLDRHIYSALEASDEAQGWVVHNGARYIVKQLSSADGSFTVVTYILERELMQDMRSFRTIFTCYVAVSALLMVALAMMVKRMLHRPLQNLVDGMRELETGNYTVNMDSGRRDEFGYVFQRFNAMAGRIDTLIHEVYKRKIQIQQMELKRLQSHINPHFLYNSLYIGYRMAKSGELDSVADLCKYLGDYFRFITYFADNQVMVKDELSFTATYLKIQKLRYRERLEYEINWEEDCGSLMIPVLVVQPLVENSILYGGNSGREVTRIQVGAHMEKSTLVLEVRDNGPGMSGEAIGALLEQLRVPEQPEQQSYGLWNIYWRVRYLYGNEDGLTLQNGPQGGLCVRVQIPMGKGEDGYAQPADRGR